MAHAVLVKNAVAAANVDSYLRYVKLVDDVDNGNVVRLIGGLSSVTGEDQVFLASTPITSYLSGVYMIAEEEIVETVVGTQVFRGIDPDVRNFYNRAGKIATAFRPHLGDIITITADGITGTPDITTNIYANAANTSYKLTAAASAGAGLALKLLKVTSIPFGTGNPITQRITAYRYEVVAV
jgi:hypothetical protein